MKPFIHYLIYKFIPYLWVHPQESYYPYEIETYINKSELWCNDTLVRDNPTLTTENLVDISEKYGVTAHQIRQRCYLHPTLDTRQGFQTNLTQAPVYAYYRNYHDFFEIQYLFFYGYNGAYNILHFFNYLDVNYGEHDGDIEHVTLRFSKSDGMLRNQTSSVLTGIYYGAHTTVEGIWVKPDQIEWQDEHPVSYVALDGHGNYPHAGIYPRIFGFASDYCDRGQLWKPSKVVIINDNPDSWHRYQGRYTVANEIENILSKTVGNQSAETNVSTNIFNRLFYLYPE